MGSVYYERSYPGGLSRAEVSSRVTEDRAAMAYDSGHSYSGNWGSKRGAGLVFYEAETFETYLPAAQYIQDQSDKWGDLIAVRYQDVAEVLPEKRKSKHAELERQWLELNRERQAYPRQVFDRVTQGSSAFKTCSGCGSKLAVARMAYPRHNLNCPICEGNLMLAAADLKKLAAMDARLAKLRQTMKALYASKDNGVQWLVGAWCPS